MPAAPIKRQADTTHLGQTQFRHIMKASFSPRMFPGEPAIIRVEKKRINTITSKIPTIIQATVDCYAGSCKNCRRHALVCRGGFKNNWWHKSQHLKASGMRRLNMTDGDRLTLQGLIEMRLGNAALHMTQYRLITDKNDQQIILCIPSKERELQQKCTGTSVFRHWSYKIWSWKFNGTKTGKCKVSYHKGW